jgi:hypothetical protein
MSSERNPGSLVWGALLVAFGLLALSGQLFRGIDFWGHFWPFIVIAFGTMFFVGMFAGGKSTSGLAIPGSIISIIGLILLYQNLTGHWESWSYAWSVIVIAVGLGIYIMGWYGGDAGQRRSGWSVMKIGLILFVIFGGFFEMIFSAGARFGLRQIFFPVALILVGLYLMLSRTGLFGRKSELPGDTPEPQSTEEKQ